jgi:hypothetical protein
MIHHTVSNHHVAHLPSSHSMVYCCSFERPSQDTFKQVISPSSLANPGGLLFRDKIEAETAIFADVQQVTLFSFKYFTIMLVHDGRLLLRISCLEILCIMAGYAAGRAILCCPSCIRVLQVKGALASWKPSLISAYTKSFGDKFKLIKEVSVWMVLS